MFVYNKQKSQRDKELKSQSVESTMLKQVEIDARKNESKIRIENTESKIIIEKNITKSNEKNIERKLVMSRNNNLYWITKTKI